MAITAYSSVSLPCYPTKSSPKAFNLHHNQAPSSLPSSKNTVRLVPVKAALATVAAPDEAVALTNSSTAQAAMVAATLSCEMERILGFRDSDNQGELDRRNGVLVRRRRRRKRRKQESEHLEVETSVIKNLSLKPRKSGQYLTRKAEAELSFCLKEEARVESLRKKVEETDGPVLTLSQWAKFAGTSRTSLDKILFNGREAQEQIIRCYKRLVISVAASHQGKGLSMQDLIQEGNLGLLYGAKKFNPRKGYKLSTYVYWWIRQYIRRAIAKKSKMTRIPGNISELVPRICEANAVLGRKLGRFPTCAEIAEQVNQNVLTVEIALGRNREPISLDQAINGGNGISLQDIIAGPAETTPEAMVKKQFMKRDIEKLLHGLCDREKFVIKSLFGLNGDTPKSLEEIGREFKLSRERIRQISWSALSNLRQNGMVNDLKVYIE